MADVTYQTFAVPPLAVFGLMLALVFAAYIPALNGELLWDDAGHVTSPELRSWAGLLRIWFEPGATQQYYPLLHSAFWLQSWVWGDEPFGYRLVNVLLHALAASGFVALLRRLAVPGSLLAGLLFALHPVCVESVAWISEQKNTLSTVLYLGAALAWLRFEEDRRPGRYMFATLLFLAALLTKSVTATLPAALLVVAWWRRGRLSWRFDGLPLLPWLVAGVSAGLFTAWFERTGIGASGSAFELSALERTLLAGRIFWFYLGKLLWPTDLAFFYPRWEIDGDELWQYLFPAALLALVGGLAWWTGRGGRRGPLAGVLLFGGTLFPALGFVNVYPFVFSYVADHFQYLAGFAVFALLAAGLDLGARSGWLGLSAGRARWLAGMVLLVLCTLTWRQAGHYTDSVALYRATLAVNPNSWVARHNLAMELARLGEVGDAVPHARRALELRPDFPEGLNNLADYLTKLGDAESALALAERALELEPRYAEAVNTLGVSLAVLGRWEEAILRFRQAIELRPSYAEAHYNLGLAEADRGEFELAIPSLEEAIRLNPEYVGAELNLGVALAVSRGLEEAMPHFERAVGLDPESAETRQIYGRTLLHLGEPWAAALQLQAALGLDPGLPGLHSELSLAFQRLGRLEEARFHAREASRKP